MAAVMQRAPGVEPQTSRSREEVDEWMIDKLPIVCDATAQTQEILDLLSVPSATRAILRAYLIEY
jgi:hypothetical protein